MPDADPDFDSAKQLFVDGLAAFHGGRLEDAHCERYVRDLASRHGLAVAQLLRAPIREEERRAIDGLYGYLTGP